MGTDTRWCGGKGPEVGESPTGQLLDLPGLCQPSDLRHFHSLNFTSLDFFMGHCKHQLRAGLWKDFQSQKVMKVDSLFIW